MGFIGVTGGVDFDISRFDYQEEEFPVVFRCP
jgi:hypothetical protein